MTHRSPLNAFGERSYSRRTRAYGWMRIVIPGEDVAADGGQTLKNGLPLFKIEPAQKWPQRLNERIIQQGFAAGVWNKEAVQTNAESLGKFLNSSKAGRHLMAFDARQEGP